MRYVVQNVDRTASSKDYRHLKDNELLVHGSFYTIQGEGPFAGMPAYFIRLAGCNFGAKSSGICEFCDTSFHLDDGKILTYDAIVGEVDTAFSPHTGLPRSLVVITGGEPTLQRNLPGLVYVLTRTAGYEVQIETNGTGHTVLRELLSLSCTVVLSPKASAKGYGPLPRFPSREELPYYDLHLKYVLDADLASMHHEVPPEALELHGQGLPVWVSPMAVYKRPYTGEVADAWDPNLVDHARTSANYKYAAEYCMKHQLRLSIQQHLFCHLA